jgi:Fe-S-cluster containining protein
MKNCNSCGKCCIKYGNGGLSASAEDLEMWEEYKPHISRYVTDQKIWMDPETGEQLERCPFLRRELREEPRKLKGSKPFNPWFLPYS